MFMQLAFPKIHPVCHNIVNGIKPGSNSKKTYKHAAEIENVNTIVERRSKITRNKQSKTLFLSSFDPCSSIVKIVFDCRLSGVVS